MQRNVFNTSNFTLIIKFSFSFCLDKTNILRVTLVNFCVLKKLFHQNKKNLIKRCFLCIKVIKWQNINYKEIKNRKKKINNQKKK